MDKRHKDLFNKILPEFTRIVDPIILLPYLDCLTSHAKEQITNRYHNQSKNWANQELHSALLRRPQGFDQLVMALEHNNYEDLAAKLDPDRAIRGPPTQQQASSQPISHTVSPQSTAPVHFAASSPHQSTAQGQFTAANPFMTTPPGQFTAAQFNMGMHQTLGRSIPHQQPQGSLQYPHDMHEAQSPYDYPMPYQFPGQFYHPGIMPVHFQGQFHQPYAVPEYFQERHNPTNMMPNQFQEHDFAMPNQFQGHPSAMSGYVQGQPSAMPGQFQGQPSAMSGQFQGQPSAMSGQFQGQPSAMSGQFQGQPSAMSGQFQGQLYAMPGQVQGQPSAVSGYFPGHYEHPKTTPDEFQGPAQYFYATPNQSHGLMYRRVPTQQDPLPTTMLESPPTLSAPSMSSGMLPTLESLKSMEAPTTSCRSLENEEPLTTKPDELLGNIPSSAIKSENPPGNMQNLHTKSGQSLRNVQQSSAVSGHLLRNVHPSSAIPGQSLVNKQSSATISGQPLGNIQPSSAMSGHSSGNVQPLSAMSGQSPGNVQPSSATSRQSPGNVQPSSAMSRQSQENVQPSSARAGQSQGNVQPSSAMAGQSQGNVQSSSAMAGQSHGNVQPSSAMAGQSPENVQHSSAMSEQSPGNIQPLSAISGQSPGNLQPSSAMSGKSPGNVQPSSAMSGQSPGNMQPSSTISGKSPRNVQPSSTIAGQSPRNIQPSSTISGQSPRNVQPSSTIAGQSPRNVQPSSTIAGQSQRNIQPSSTISGQSQRNILPSSTISWQSPGNTQPLPTENRQSLGNIELLPAMSGQSLENRQPSPTETRQKLGNIKPAESEQSLGNLQPLAGQSLGNVQFPTGQSLGNLQFSARQLLGNLQPLAGQSLGNVQFSAGQSLGNVQFSAGQSLGYLHPSAEQSQIQSLLSRPDLPNVQQDSPVPSASERFVQPSPSVPPTGAASQRIAESSRGEMQDLTDLENSLPSQESNVGNAANAQPIPSLQCPQASVAKEAYKSRYIFKFQPSQESNVGNAENAQPIPSLQRPQASVAKEAYKSRFCEDFNALRVLGKGAFGVVLEAENKLDRHHYAVKRIKLKGNDPESTVMPEVRALAQLDHPGIVRYYQAWMETPPRGWQEEQDVHMEGLSTQTGTETETTSSQQQSDDEENSKQVAVNQPPRNAQFKDLYNFGANNCMDFSARDARPHDQATESSVSDSSGWSTDQGSSRNAVSKELKEDNEDEKDEEEGEEEEDDNIVFENSESSREMKQDHVKKKAKNNALEDAMESNRQVDRVEHDLNRQDQRLKRLNINSPSLQVPPTFLYIQTELCKAETLKVWLDKTKTRNINEILKMLREIMAALAYIHKMSYMHRDLKPANIFFALNNSVKLGDFGLAKIMAEERSESLDMAMVAKSQTAGVGTYLYTSPEQTGTKYTNKVDIFALGIILIEMFRYFDTASERVTVLKAARRRDFPDQFQVDHLEWCETVRQMLSAEPDERPTAQQLLDSDLLRP